VTTADLLGATAAEHTCPWCSAPKTNLPGLCSSCGRFGRTPGQASDAALLATETGSGTITPSPTAEPKPLWLLDYDGVVNAILSGRNAKPDRNAWQDWQRTDIYSAIDGVAYPVCYSPTVVAFIAAAVTAGVDVRWLTTWQSDTARFPAAMPGMPVLPWLPEPVALPRDADLDAAGLPVASREHTFQPWWKLRVARATAGDRPLVWTDDDLGVYKPELKEARAWAERRARTHVVIPNEGVGLTPARLRKIRNFLADHGVHIPS
jgi:hypothetical protein